MTVLATAHITVPSGDGGLSSWTRAHADSPGITWDTRPGPGGTIVIRELDQPRDTLATTAGREAAR